MRFPWYRFSCIYAVFFGLAILGQAQQTGTRSQYLGRVHFPTSCSAQVQPELDRGVALLHSFEYDKASSQFQEVERQEPRCRIAYWGSAMALYHELWDPPSQDDLAEGWQFVQKAENASEKSPREQAYIATMAAFYKPGKQTMDERATTYSQSMEKLHAAYPSDEEATVFYALSLLASEPGVDTSLSYARKAAAILEQVFAKDPDHPGAAHYLIHACDNPRMAAQAVSAAKHYAMIAPSSPHALHMPSHIFARLGLWQDDLASNLASVAAAEREHSGAEARLHSMDFLEYAYLQTGQDDKALEIEEKAAATANRGFSHGMEPYYFYVQAHFPALLALETRNWKAAELLQPTANAEPGFKVITYWAQAIGAGHRRDVATAKVAVDNLNEARAESRKLHRDVPIAPVDTNQNEAEAWLAFAQKDNTRAFKLLQSVIEFQDDVGKGEVELPAREMYADMLLQLNRPAEALQQYQLSLKSDPNRFNGLYGAARSAQLESRTNLAKGYYEQLLRNCDARNASERPELQEARHFISQTTIAKVPIP